MRAIAAAASLSGALAFTALAVPAAQADGSAAPTTREARDFAKQAAASADAGSKSRSLAADASGDPYAIDATFSNVKVNGGKPIVAGTTSVVHAPVSYTLTHPADVDVTSPEVLTDVDIYWVNADASDGNVLFDLDYATCTPVTATTATCTQSIDVDPADLWNVDAGKAWKAEGSLVDTNGIDLTDENADFSQVGFAYQDQLASTTLQRRSTLTVNASPEPVYKGRTITVTGYLKRANWDTAKYAGYTKQAVKLQYRKKGTTSYPSTYLKTATSSSTGYLKTTYTASADGYWRYNFLGTSTTPAVKASGDYVDVR
ncbi:hypothetical protein V2W30_17795 [Streptomyces sp. Q6]|uniref:Uncharacterized protein n=1 Tax=Streptomyces citrinus TaxID=3118173 RepID=A0ACD5AD54_9ACTN